MNREGLLELFGKLGVDKIRVHERSGNVQVACPLAPWTHEKGTDRDPSCSVKISAGDVSVFRCFACGEKGTLVGLVSKMNRHKGGVLEDLLKEVAKAEQQDLATQVERAAQKYDPHAPKAADALRRIDFDVWDEKEIAEYVGKVPKYAIDRGISVDTCREWQLGFDKKGQRLVFPIRRMPDAALVGVIGRALHEGMEPRYKDYWGFEKSKYLYGENRIDPNLKKLIVVEGPMKVLKLWTYGHRNVVATMGASASYDQLRKIRDWGLPTYMMQDGDKAGRAARKVFEANLLGRLPLFDVKLPHGADPDEMRAEEVQQVLETAELVM